MPEGLVPALLAAAAFLLGAVPFGLLVAKAVSGVDVRTVGSGNVGATNVSRALGRPWFFVVFALDAGKGVAPVLLFPGFAGLPHSEWMRAGCGLAAVLGHVFSPFLRFRGGKGVATGAGAAAALAPLPALAALGVFVLVLTAFRYVSLASVCTAVALAPLSLAFGASPQVAVFGVVAAAIVVARHRENLGRIAAGTEPRIFARKEPRGG
jgi:glycerol-3-phosphate acyltransferase PlsY